MPAHTKSKFSAWLDRLPLDVSEGEKHVIKIFKQENCQNAVLLFSGDMSF